MVLVSWEWELDSEGFYLTSESSDLHLYIGIFQLGFKLSQRRATLSLDLLSEEDS